MTKEMIVEAAKALSLQDRMEVAILIHENVVESDPPISDAWRLELEKRFQSVLDGTAEGISAEELHATLDVEGDA